MKFVQEVMVKEAPIDVSLGRGGLVSFGEGFDSTNVIDLKLWLGHRQVKMRLAWFLPWFWEMIW